MVKTTQLTRGQRSRVMYIEPKSGHRDNGPAWIARVTFSKSGRSIFYRGRDSYASREALATTWTSKRARNSGFRASRGTARTVTGLAPAPYRLMMTLGPNTKR